MHHLFLSLNEAQFAKLESQVALERQRRDDDSEKKPAAAKNSQYFINSKNSESTTSQELNLAELLANLQNARSKMELALSTIENGVKTVSSSSSSSSESTTTCENSTTSIGPSVKMQQQQQQQQQQQHVNGSQLRKQQRCTYPRNSRPHFFNRVVKPADGTKRYFFVLNCSQVDSEQTILRLVPMQAKETFWTGKRNGRPRYQCIVGDTDEENFMTVNGQDYRVVAASETVKTSLVFQEAWDIDDDEEDDGVENMATKNNNTSNDSDPLQVVLATESEEQKPTAAKSHNAYNSDNINGVSNTPSSRSAVTSYTGDWGSTGSTSDKKRPPSTPTETANEPSDDSGIGNNNSPENKECSEPASSATHERVQYMDYSDLRKQKLPVFSRNCPLPHFYNRVVKPADGTKRYFFVLNCNEDSEQTILRLVPMQAKGTCTGKRRNGRPRYKCILVGDTDEENFMTVSAKDYQVVPSTQTMKTSLVFQEAWDIKDEEEEEEEKRATKNKHVDSDPQADNDTSTTADNVGNSGTPPTQSIVTCTTGAKQKRPPPKETASEPSDDSGTDNNNNNNGHENKERSDPASAAQEKVERVDIHDDPNNIEKLARRNNNENNDCVTESEQKPTTELHKVDSSNGSSQQATTATSRIEITITHAAGTSSSPNKKRPPPLGMEPNNNSSENYSPVYGLDFLGGILAKVSHSLASQTIRWGVSENSNTGNNNGPQKKKQKIETPPSVALPPNKHGSPGNHHGGEARVNKKTIKNANKLRTDPPTGTRQPEKQKHCAEGKNDSVTGDEQQDNTPLKSTTEPPLKPKRKQSRPRKTPLVAPVLLDPNKSKAKTTLTCELGNSDTSKSRHVRVQRPSLTFKWNVCFFLTSNTNTPGRSFLTIANRSNDDGPCHGLVDGDAVVCAINGIRVGSSSLNSINKVIELLRQEVQVLMEVRSRLKMSGDRMVVVVSLS